MNSIQLACTAQSSDEYNCQDFLAVMTLTEQKIRRLLSLMDMAAECQEKEKELYCLTVFDSFVEYYEDTCLYEDVDEVYGQWRELTYSTDNLKEIVRTDACCKDITPDFIEWDCFLKHTNIRVTTPSLTRKELETFLAKLVTSNVT